MGRLGRVEPLAGEGALLEQRPRARGLLRGVGQHRFGRVDARARDGHRGGRLVGRRRSVLALERRECGARCHAITEVDQHPLEAARRLRGHADTPRRGEAAGDLECGLDVAPHGGDDGDVDGIASRGRGSRRRGPAAERSECSGEQGDRRPVASGRWPVFGGRWAVAGGRSSIGGTHVHTEQHGFSSAVRR